MKVGATLLSLSSLNREVAKSIKKKKKKIQYWQPVTKVGDYGPLGLYGRIDYMRLIEVQRAVKMIRERGQK